MKKRKGIYFLIFALIITLFPSNVFAIETYKDGDHNHDKSGYEITSGYFDWKDFSVSINGETGAVDKISVKSWYNYTNAGAIKGRDYGVLFIQKGSDNGTDGTAFFRKNSNEANTLFSKGINIGKTNYPHDTYCWTEFTIDDSEALKSLDFDKDYRIWIWTKENQNSYAFESCMGTMTRVKLNYYLSTGSDNYDLAKTVYSMSVIGAKFNTSGVFYPNATLNEAKTGVLANTSSKDQEYNLYFDLNLADFINFSDGTFKGEASTEYKITEGENTYNVISNENGTIPFVTDNYDLTGKTIIITKSGEAGLKITIPFLPIAEELDKANVSTTASSISLQSKFGYEYSVDGKTWKSSSNEDGTVTFDGLNGYTDYTVYYRVAARENSFASNIKTLSVKTLCGHSYELKSDDTHHWHECSICGEVKDKDLHKDENKDNKCDTCNKVLTLGEIKTLDYKQNDNYGKSGIKNSLDEIKNNVLTNDDKEAMEDGKDVSIWLETKELTSISNNDQRAVIDKLPKDYSIGAYLDVNLWKKIGEENATKVSNTKDNVTICFIIPKSLQKKGRNYKIIRVHEGTATVIDTSVNDKFELIFETNQFSTYALVYEGGKVNTPAKSYSSKDKNHDGVITCDEQMNSANWIWSESKKACVYKVSNTSTKY